jgi:hypothetical protein
MGREGDGETGRGKEGERERQRKREREEEKEKEGGGEGWGGREGSKRRLIQGRCQEEQRILHDLNSIPPLPLEERRAANQCEGHRARRTLR